MNHSIERIRKDTIESYSDEWIDAGVWLIRKKNIERVTAANTESLTLIPVSGSQVASSEIHIPLVLETLGFNLK